MKMFKIDSVTKAKSWSVIFNKAGMAPSHICLFVCLFVALLAQAHSFQHVLMKNI